MNMTQIMQDVMQKRGMMNGMTGGGMVPVQNTWLAKREKEMGLQPGQVPPSSMVTAPTVPQSALPAAKPVVMPPQRLGMAGGGTTVGLIPGKVDPTVADDTTITTPSGAEFNAKIGEYVIPQEVVAAKGTEFFDNLVMGTKKKLGLPLAMGPKMHDEPDSQGRMDKPGLPMVMGHEAGGPAYVSKPINQWTPDDDEAFRVDTDSNIKNMVGGGTTKLIGAAKKAVSTLPAVSQAIKRITPNLPEVVQSGLQRVKTISGVGNPRETFEPIYDAAQQIGRKARSGLHLGGKNVPEQIASKWQSPGGAAEDAILVGNRTGAGSKAGLGIPEWMDRGVKYASNSGLGRRLGLGPAALATGAAIGAIVNNDTPSSSLPDSEANPGVSRTDALKAMQAEDAKRLASLYQAGGAGFKTPDDSVAPRQLPTTTPEQDNASRLAAQTKLEAGYAASAAQQDQWSREAEQNKAKEARALGINNQNGRIEFLNSLIANNLGNQYNGREIVAAAQAEMASILGQQKTAQAQQGIDIAAENAAATERSNRLGRQDTMTLAQMKDATERREQDIGQSQFNETLGIKKDSAALDKEIKQAQLAEHKRMAEMSGIPYEALKAAKPSERLSLWMKFNNKGDAKSSAEADKFLYGEMSSYRKGLLAGEILPGTDPGMEAFLTAQKMMPQIKSK